MAEDFVFDLYQDMEEDNSSYPVYSTLTHTVEELAGDGVEVLLLLDFDGVINIIKNQSVKYYPTGDDGLFEELEESINYNYYQVDNIKDVMNVHYTPPLAWLDNPVPRSFSIRWSSEMIEDLNKVCSSPSVQVISLTTWRQWMREPCELMGFKPAREVLNLQWGSDNPKLRLYYDQRCKPVGLSTYLSRSKIPAGMKMAWIDDEILKNQNRHYLDGLPKPFFDEDVSLLVAPKENYGISRKEMDMLERFVSGKQ